MSYIIDRRLNSSDKNLPNKERFRLRHKEIIQRAVKKLASSRSISDTKGGSIQIDPDGIDEPTFRKSGDGIHDLIAPGNDKYIVGDQISKRGGAGGGSQGSRDGDGVDPFQFLLSEEEYLDALFADLALPDLVKKSLTGSNLKNYIRAGFTTTGSPANLSIVKTMRNSLTRRIALNRPSKEEIEKLQQLLQDESISQEEKNEIINLLDSLQKRKLAIPYIDNFDVRYKNTTIEIKPKTKAVMFAVMDVSASMGEKEKDIAKRFFLLLHVFLKRNYETVEIVFVRHTHYAKIVDEKTFFYDTETGGTVVSSAFKVVNETIKKDYNPDEWNIYLAQASDGDNSGGDDEELLEQLHILMPKIQYLAYIEVRSERFGIPANISEVWELYDLANLEFNYKIAMKRAKDPADIFPVFKELFSKNVSVN
jgi:uncharacterized protein